MCIRDRYYINSNKLYCFNIFLVTWRWPHKRWKYRTEFIRPMVYVQLNVISNYKNNNNSINISNPSSKFTCEGPIYIYYFSLNMDVLCYAMLTCHNFWDHTKLSSSITYDWLYCNITGVIICHICSKFWRFL